MIKLGPPWGSIRSGNLSAVVTINPFCTDKSSLGSPCRQGKLRGSTVHSEQNDIVIYFFFLKKRASISFFVDETLTVIHVDMNENDGGDVTFILAAPWMGAMVCHGWLVALPEYSSRQWWHYLPAFEWCSDHLQKREWISYAFLVSTKQSELFWREKPREGNYEQERVPRACSLTQNLWPQEEQGRIHGTRCA